MDLLNLPELALDCIVDHLSCKDQVRFSQTCSSFVHYKPTSQLVRKKAISFHEKYGDGHYCPKTYFDLPIKHEGLKYMRLRLEWKDQGWGKRKGNIWIELVRGEEV